MARLEEFDFAGLRRHGIEPEEARRIVDRYLFYNPREPVFTHKLQRAFRINPRESQASREAVDALAHYINSRVREQRRYTEEFPNNAFLAAAFETRQGYAGPTLRQALARWLLYHYPREPEAVEQFTNRHLGKLLFHLGVPELKEAQTWSHLVTDPADKSSRTLRARREVKEKFFGHPLKKVGPHIRRFFERYLAAREWHHQNRERLAWP